MSEHLAAGFEGYRRALLAPELTEDQLHEHERAFMAGATVVMGLLVDASRAAAEGRTQQIADELNTEIRAYALLLASRRD